MSCWCGEHSSSVSKHAAKGEKSCAGALTAKREADARYRARNREALRNKTRARRQQGEQGWVAGSDILMMETDEL